MQDDRDQDWKDLLPGGTATPAARRLAERAEIAALRLERSTLLGRIDAQQGEIDAMNRQRAADYERGVREGNRQRALPSVVGSFLGNA